MSEILVDLDWLASLATEVGETVEDLRASPADAVSMPSQPFLDGGVTRFMKRWDEKAEELAVMLEAVYDLTVAVHDSFAEADQQLGDSTS